MTVTIGHARLTSGQVRRLVRRLNSRVATLEGALAEVAQAECSENCLARQLAQTWIRSRSPAEGNSARTKAAHHKLRADKE